MELICFLEERSAKEMLRHLLPRLIGESIDTKYICFSGKGDLKKRLDAKINGYNSCEDRTLFLVMCDQDNEDCRALKDELLAKISEAGRRISLVRVVCRELESFYLGDLQAVEKGLDKKGIAKKQNSSKYRNPDEIRDAYEDLDKLTAGKYQKISGSRAIAQHLDIDNNRSHSFKVLCEGIKNLFSTQT